MSLGDGWPGFARRGVAFRTSYLPFFSGPALLISAAERRSAKKRLPRRGSRTQGCSNKQLGARVLLCAALVAPVNPTLPQLILHAPRHGKREDASSSRHNTSSEGSNFEGAVLSSARKTLAKAQGKEVQRCSVPHECSGHELT